MKALGLDAVEISRIAHLLDSHRERFLSRVYTDAERRQALEGEGELSFLAGRFAAKEATLKALGTGWRGGIAFRDVEVLRGPQGVPEVRLSGLAAARAGELGLRTFLVSITHTRRDAHAVVAAD